MVSGLDEYTKLGSDAAGRSANKEPFSEISAFNISCDEVVVHMNESWLEDMPVGIARDIHSKCLCSIAWFKTLYIANGETRPSQKVSHLTTLVNATGQGVCHRTLMPNEGKGLGFTDFDEQPVDTSQKVVTKDLVAALLWTSKVFLIL